MMRGGGKIRTMTVNPPPQKKYLKPHTHTHTQVDWLTAQPGVRQVFYPRLTQRAVYDAYKRPEGGYGGLFSVSLAEGLSPTAFYDALDVYKGPSLGTNYTLACPYTLLVGTLGGGLGCGGVGVCGRGVTIRICLFVCFLEKGNLPHTTTENTCAHRPRSNPPPPPLPIPLFPSSTVLVRRTTTSWTSPRPTACAPTSCASPSASRTCRCAFVASLCVCVFCLFGFALVASGI